MLLRSFAITFALLVSGQSAHADTLILENYSAGTYTYALDGSYQSPTTFSPGDSIQMIGLYNVTGATSLVSNFSVAYTATSVTWTMSGPQYTRSTFPGCGGGTCFFDVFTVTSPSSIPGSVYFSVRSIDGGGGLISGPSAPATAATPEPTSLALLATGVLYGVGAVRRRFHDRG